MAKPGKLAKGIAKKINPKLKFNKKGVEPNEVGLSRQRYPASARHIEDARRAGQPDVLTLDRSRAKQNRRDSLRGQPTVRGKDRDEYPPAMSREGGQGASVRPIAPGDNRGSGSTIGHQLRDYPDGTRYRVRLDP